MCPEPEPVTDPMDSDLDEVRKNFAKLRKLGITLNKIREDLKTRILEKMAGSEVLARSHKVQLGAVKLDFLPVGILQSVTADSAHGHKPRITLHPQHKLGCTCPDFLNRKRVCKHVLALVRDCDKNLGEKGVEITTTLCMAEREVRNLLVNMGNGTVPWLP